MAIIKINVREVNTDKVLVKTTRKVKTVGDFIKELQPNFERIVMHAMGKGEKPFQDPEHLKRWLVNNQEGYPHFNADIFNYFLTKCQF